MCNSISSLFYFKQFLSSLYKTYLYHQFLMLKMCTRFSSLQFKYHHPGKKTTIKSFNEWSKFLFTENTSFYESKSDYCVGLSRKAQLCPNKDAMLAKWWTFWPLIKVVRVQFLASEHEMDCGHPTGWLCFLWVPQFPSTVKAQKHLDLCQQVF